jgi:YD repeat-containing protein
MKTQYKFSIVLGLLFFLSFGLFGQQKEIQQIKSTVVIDTVKINTEAAKGGGGGTETDAFDIGFQGGNFVAMPSPNSMTLVQQINAGADLYTGKVQSSIPITSLSSYDISVPVTMSYSSNGIKVDDIGSWVGTGWDLQAGGKITRVMHNLPDEFNGILSDYDNGNLWDGEDRDGYGYLYLNQAVIDGNNIPFNLSTFYSNSQDDKQTIAKHADWQSCKDCEVALDTEPDEFYFSFGGYNGKFIFGQGGVINTIPNMNLEISKSINGNQQITQFEVKTPEGMIYTFGTTGNSLDGVETSRLTQTTLANRYEYKKIGADCTPWEIGDPGYNPAFPFAPCGEEYEYTYYYDIEPTLSYIDYTEGLSGIRANDWNIENADLTPNINHLEGKIRNSISKRLGFFSSTWHLKSISSPSGDFVTFNYEDESFRYTQSRNYTWEMPNFTLYENPYNGNSRFESKREPEERYENIFNVAPEYYPEFASLIYSVSEITITGKRLSSIVASNNRSLEFVPTDADRVDLFGAKGLKEIAYKISNTRKKSWAFAYEEAINLVNASPNWSYVYAGAVILPTEDAIKLNAYNITFSGSSPSVAEPPKYMQAFRSLCDIKHKAWDLYNPNNGTGIMLEDYYDSEFTRLWKPEFNRFFLNIITEKGKNNEAIDLVDLDYYSQNDLPKRFSYKQDQFGFYNNNTRSTLLSKVPYDINLNDYKTFAFDDIQTSDDEFLGHQDSPNSAKARVGILRRIKYHTGANKSFEYSSNDYGVKLFAVNVSPAGTPDYKESYTYSSPIWMNQGGIDPNPSQGNGAALKRYTGIPVNYEDDKWIMNSYQSRPGQMTKGTYKAYRRVNQSITDGNNQSLGRTQYHFSAVNTHPNLPPAEFWIWDNVDGAVAEYSYPYAPFTDVDYNRGVLDKVEVYDKSNQIISETINSWSFDYDTPTTIFGLQTAAIDRYEEDEDDNWVAHRADRYRFLSNRYRLESTTQKHYEQDPNNSLDVVTSYTYNTNHDVASQSVSGGGVSQTTEYLRVSDIPGYTTQFPEMVARNMTSPVWVTNQFYSGNQVGGSKVDFKTNWSNCSGCILPWKTYSFEDSWELKSTITSVNAHGQPLQIQREHYADPIVFNWESDGLLDVKRYASWLWDYEYDDDRLLLSMTDVDAQVTTYGYDGFGKLDKIEERFGARNTDIVYGYGGIGGSGENFVKSTTVASGVAFIPPSKEVFDGLGRSLKTTQEGYTPSGADFVSSQVYDAFGRLTKSSDPSKGASIQYEYEDSPRSRVIEQSAQGSISSVFFKYELNTSADAVNGHSPYTLYKTTTFDENGYPSETYTDILGRTILLRKKVDGAPVETYYNYNNKGLLEKITQPNGELFEYGYYPDRMLESKTIPGGGTSIYTYNDKNQLETATDPNGNVLTYRYNKYDQPTRTLLDGVMILNNTYHDSGMGNKGRLHQTFASGINTGGEFVTSLVYDKFGRVENETRQHPVANDAYVYTY